MDGVTRRVLWTLQAGWVTRAHTNIYNALRFVDTVDVSRRVWRRH